MRGEADPDATVTVNGNPTFRLGAYYFGSDNFDNTSNGGFAELETYAALAQTNADGEETDDLVSSVTNQVYLAQSPETFAYDADGNQTLIATKTGLWRVTYNGENRPVRWVRDSDGAVITMSYDHMGRRRTKNSKRFYYDGYLQVADSDGNRYVWDPTEPTATRPLAWMHGETISYYTHDGNKNVSEVITNDGTVAAHYEYAPFGATILQRGDSLSTNPWRFSSEYAEDDTATVYYNYRHYEPVIGRWLSRDSMEEEGCKNLYALCENNIIMHYDYLGRAHFEVRALSGAGVIWNYSCFARIIGLPTALALDLGLADKLNIEILHEHLFYDDGTNVGYTDSYKFSETSKKGYRRRDMREYDDCIMKEAEARVKPPPYSLLGFGRPKYNCQDYADSLRRKYDEIKDLKEIKCKCRKKQ